MDRPKRDTPKTAAEETAEFVAQKVARMGADIKCETCFHCYTIRLTPLSRSMDMVCYEGPPGHQFFSDGHDGITARHVPRIVGKEFFCHRWKTRD